MLHPVASEDKGAEKLHSFGEVLGKSLCLEQMTSAWCEPCQKYQPTTQSRRLKTLPSVLSVNCGMESNLDFQFWSEQMKHLLEKSQQKAGTGSPVQEPPTEVKDVPPLTVRPCRYGKLCARPNCKFWHEGRDHASKRDSCEDFELCMMFSSQWILVAASKRLFVLSGQK